MLGFGRLSDFLYAQLLPIAALAGLLLAGLIVLYLSGISRHRRMIAARKGEDVESFVLNLASLGFDPEIARDAYDYIVTQEDIGFPIHASDRLDYDLRLSEEEIHSMVIHLLDRNSREALPGMNPARFLHVEDVLRYVQASPILEAMDLSPRHSALLSGDPNARAAG